MDAVVGITNMHANITSMATANATMDDEIVGKLCRSRRYQSNVAKTAFVLAANRLCEPRSEHDLGGVGFANGQTTRLVSGGSRDARPVLKALGGA